QTAQIVAQAGGDCIAVATDVTEEDSVRAAIDAAVRHYGGLHILHNNAGGSTPVDSTVVEVPIEEGAVIGTLPYDRCTTIGHQPGGGRRTPEKTRCCTDKKAK